jgi:SAM-dependent methyltransferase
MKVLPMQNSEYSGKDVLEIMKQAKNYHDELYAWLASGMSADMSILELGAGNGVFCNRFTSNDIIAVEPDLSLQAEIKCKKINDLAEVKGKFDLIYSVNVLEHIEDDQAMIDQLTALLKPGGRLKIFVPARNELFSQFDRSVSHFRRYNRRTLLKLFKNNLLQVKVCAYYDLLGYLTALIHKLLIRSGDLSASSVMFYDRIIFPLSRFCDKITCGRLIGKNLLLEAMKVKE